jgi:2-methylcitrate dehydratase PrpD
VRVGTAMDGTPDGVHDIATWGTVGAAAGVAHVLSGGSPDIIEAAIEMSATMPMLPDAMTVFSGASAQHAFLGVGAHQGVVWGTLAMSGLRAPVGTLERHFALRSSRDFHPTALGGGLHSDGRFSAFSILDGYVKRHPTCAHLHGANDSIEAILARWDGSAEDIESVVVETYLAASVFNDVAPTNDLAARFSIPFSVAVALVTRRLDNSSFEPRWLNDKSVTSLADRVEVRHNPDFDDGYPSGRPTMVTIILRSGKRFVEYSALPRGDGADAMSDDFVVAKPRRLFESQISAERADLLLSTIDGLAASNVSVLSSALRGLFDSV